MLKGLGAVSGTDREAAGGADALIKLESNEFGTVLLDPEIEDLDVPELVGVMQQRYPQLEVVVMDHGDGSQLLSCEISGRRAEGLGTPEEVQAVVAEAQPRSRDLCRSGISACARPRLKFAPIRCLE